MLYRLNLARTICDEFKSIDQDLSRLFLLNYSTHFSSCHPLKPLLSAETETVRFRTK